MAVKNQAGVLYYTDALPLAPVPPPSPPRVPAPALAPGPTPTRPGPRPAPAHCLRVAPRAPSPRLPAHDRRAPRCFCPLRPVPQRRQLLIRGPEKLHKRVHKAPRA